MLDKVQLIRDDAKRGLVITSGGRCPNHPDEIKRTKPADHQNCVAVDIRVYGGIERMELVRLGLKHGANAIGVAKTFVHLGWREDSPACYVDILMGFIAKLFGGSDIVGAIERVALEAIDTPAEERRGQTHYGLRTLDPNGIMRRNLSSFACRAYGWYLAVSLVLYLSSRFWDY